MGSSKMCFTVQKARLYRLCVLLVQCACPEVRWRDTLQTLRTHLCARARSKQHGSDRCLWSLNAGGCWFDHRNCIDILYGDKNVPVLKTGERKSYKTKNDVDVHHLRFLWIHRQPTWLNQTWSKRNRREILEKKEGLSILPLLASPADGINSAGICGSLPWENWL